MSDKLQPRFHSAVEREAHEALARSDANQRAYTRAELAATWDQGYRACREGKQPHNPYRDPQGGP